MALGVHVRCDEIDQMCQLWSSSVKMSGICSGVWTCMIWLPASSLCRSNNRFRFTRWVREICPMDGLRSFMVILITASSKTNIDDLWLEMCEFEKHSQYCPLTYYPSWDILSLELGVTYGICPSWRLQKIVNHVPQIERRNSFPSQSSIYWDDFCCGAALWKHLLAVYMSSLSKRMCDTCTWSPWDHPAKSASWKSPCLQCWGVLQTLHYCLWTVKKWKKGINLTNRSSRLCDSTCLEIYRPWKCRVCRCARNRRILNDLR